MTQFCISVPIGAYHPLLRECLKSLAIQNPRPQVALLDASNDARVKAAADEFAEILTYRRHGPDDGQSDAIIEGWNNLEGDVLGWLNADDVLYPGVMERVARMFEERASLDVVCGHSTIINDDDHVKGYHWAVERPSETILIGDTISQPSCFFRRARYEAIGGLNANLHYTMDWDLWVRLWRANAEFAFVDQALSRVLWTAEAKTGGFNKIRRKEIEAILALSASPQRRFKSLIGFGMHYVFEYLLPERIARTLRRSLTGGGAVIHGIGRNGEIDDEARIPLTHYLDKSRRQIDAVFERGAENMSLHIDGRRCEQSVDQSKITLTLSEPFQEGELLTLVMKNQGPAAAYFSHLSFS